MITFSNLFSPRTSHMEDTFTDIQPVNKYLEWGFCGLLFSHSVVSDFFWPHGLQHTRLPYPSPSPGACSNSCPSSWWCHPTISSSVIPFSSCLQSFPASRSFFQWVSSSHQVAKVLELQLQHESLQSTFRVDLLKTDFYLAEAIVFRDLFVTEA